MMSLKCERFLYERKVSVLSQTDLLTGLCNRNSYEQRLKEYASAGSMAVACIYVDVNGLHEMNNTMGHAAGDRMLKFVGSILQKSLGRIIHSGLAEMSLLFLRHTKKLNQLMRKQIELKSFPKKNHIMFQLDILLETLQKQIYLC